VDVGDVSPDLTVASYTLGTGAEAPMDLAGNLMVSTALPSSNLGVNSALVMNGSSNASFASVTQAITEGNAGATILTVTVNLDIASTSDLTVNYRVMSSGANAATAGDFVGSLLPSGVITFAAGETSKTFTVEIAGDVVIEANETFQIVMDSPSLGLIVTGPADTVTITNDDAVATSPRNLTAGNDTYVAVDNLTPWVSGGNGNDSMDARGAGVTASVVFDGGAGNDTLFGGVASDQLLGGAGMKVLSRFNFCI
jgi:Ca2+-binding RTX toxin-like protein